MLSAFKNPGRFFRGNLHTHSTLSDGLLAPEEVCRRYAANGYDFICLSDHFIEKYDFPIADTKGFRSNTFTTLLGAEVHTGKMLLDEPWHILAVGLPENFAGTTPDETGPSLAQRCADAGAFVTIAHPQWYGLLPDEAATIEAAHAVEVYNHTAAISTTRSDGTYLLDELLNRGRKLTAIAADDAHFFDDMSHANADAFGGWVMVKAEGNSPEALLTALKTGDFYASTGPELHDITQEGDQLVVKCSPVVSVIALGRGTRSAFVHGTSLTHAVMNVSKFQGDWVRILTIDRAGKRAFSNPLWLD